MSEAARSVAEEPVVSAISPRVSVIRGTGLSAHAYVVRGDSLTAVIDTGSEERAPLLVSGLARLGLEPRGVALVLNTREHFDHVGGNSAFPSSTLVGTSGSTCFFEPKDGLLFSGDTLFAGGVPSYIAESGSLGDYLDTLSSLAELKTSLILPGHGRPSTDGAGDIARAAAAARGLLAGEPVPVRRSGCEPCDAALG